MEYVVKGEATYKQAASIQVKETELLFGITPNQELLPNPVELLLSSFAACCLKNVERFAAIMGFTYETATIEVIGTRQTKPTKLTAIQYELRILSTDPKLNLDLLHKNIQNHGTIYNTLKEIISIKGEVRLME